jgi:hypothetical protein
MASVYVFNATIETIALVLNGEPIGAFEGMSPANGYALTASAIPLTAGSNPGQFGSDNQLNVEIMGGQFGFNVPIASTGMDYQLFVFDGTLVLASQTSLQTLSPAGQGFIPG